MHGQNLGCRMGYGRGVEFKPGLRFIFPFSTAERSSISNAADPEVEGTTKQAVLASRRLGCSDIVDSRRPRFSKLMSRRARANFD